MEIPALWTDHLRSWNVGAIPRGRQKARPSSSPPGRTGLLKPSRLITAIPARSTPRTVTRVSHWRRRNSAWRGRPQDAGRSGEFRGELQHPRFQSLGKAYKGAVNIDGVGMRAGVTRSRVWAWTNLRAAVFPLCVSACDEHVLKYPIKIICIFVEKIALLLFICAHLSLLITNPLELPIKGIVEKPMNIRLRIGVLRVIPVLAGVNTSGTMTYYATRPVCGGRGREHDRRRLYRKLGICIEPHGASLGELDDRGRRHRADGHSRAGHMGNDFGWIWNAHLHPKVAQTPVGELKSRNRLFGALRWGPEGVFFKP